MSRISNDSEDTLCVCLPARCSVHVDTVKVVSLPEPGVSDTIGALQAVTAYGDLVLQRGTEPELVDCIIV